MSLSITRLCRHYGNYFRYADLSVLNRRLYERLGDYALENEVFLMTLDKQRDAVLEPLQHVFERQRSSFRQCTPLGPGKRLEALEILSQSIINHEDAIIEAVKADFGQRSLKETRLLEIFPLVDEIRYL